MSSSAGELDPLVAAQAGVRRAAGCVLGDEVLDDVALEAAREVPDVEGDAEHVGHPPRVTGVLQVQQPRADSRRVAAERDRARCTPTTSWPASSMRAAATAESTPPDMAATTRISAGQLRGPSRPLDDRGQGGEEGVDVGLGRRVAEGQPQGSPAPRTRCAPWRAARGWAAGRPPGTPSRCEHSTPGGVEEVEQRVALAAGHEQVGVAGQPARAVAGLQPPVTVMPRPEAQGALEEAVAQAHRARSASTSAAATVSSSATANARMAGTSRVPLRTWRSWPPPWASGHERGVPAGERARRRRAGPPTLCAETVIEVGAGLVELDRQVPDGLHGVGVERHPVLVGDGGELRDRLHGADLVVGPHDAGQGDVVGVLRQALAQVVDREVAAPVGLEPGHPGALLREELDRVEDRVVLDAAHDEPGACRVRGEPRGIRALDGQVVGLGAPGREDDLGRSRAQRARDALPRLLDDRPGGPARGVQRRGVPDAGGLLGQGLDGGRQHGSGRRVVEVVRSRWSSLRFGARGRDAPGAGPARGVRGRPEGATGSSPLHLVRDVRGIPPRERWSASALAPADLLGRLRAGP